MNIRSARTVNSCQCLGGMNGAHAIAPGQQPVGYGIDARAQRLGPRCLASDGVLATVGSRALAFGNQASGVR
jgi:hypothetical protein